MNPFTGQLGLSQFRHTGQVLGQIAKNKNKAKYPLSKTNRPGHSALFPISSPSPSSNTASLTEQSCHSHLCCETDSCEGELGRASSPARLSTGLVLKQPIRLPKILMRAPTLVASRSFSTIMVIQSAPSMRLSMAPQRLGSLPYH